MEKPMSYLSVEYSLTVHSKLVHQGTKIFADIMDDFNNISILQNIFKAERKWVHFYQVNHKALAI